MIEHTVDYSFLAKEAERIIRNGKYLLLETLAEDVCDYCLNLPGVSSVNLSVKKPKHYQKQNLSELKFIVRTDLEAL